MGQLMATTLPCQYSHMQECHPLALGFQRLMIQFLFLFLLSTALARPPFLHVLWRFLLKSSSSELAVLNIIYLRALSLSIHRTQMAETFPWIHKISAFQTMRSKSVQVFRSLKLQMTIFCFVGYFCFAK